MKRFYNWLTRPHSRLKKIEDRRGAQLFSGLMLVHFALVLLAINAINLFHLQRTGNSIWNAQDAWVTLAGLIVIGASFLLLRGGFYKPAVIIYIINTAVVALWAPFVQSPNAEIGLLASATIPVLLTAMVFSYRWAISILLGILAVGTAQLSFASLPLRETETGFALLIVVAVTGGLILVLRHHLDCLEKERHSQIRKVATKYRNLFDSVADGIFILDRDGRVVEANSEACKQLGYTREELIDLPVTNISARPDLDLKSLTSELRRKGRLSYITGHKRKDGSTFPVELRLTLIEHQGDSNILGVARDVTEQQAELSFREAVISHAAEGLCVCHQIDEYPYVKFSLWNSRMCELTGYAMDEINRLGWYQTLYPDPDLQARAVGRMSEMRDGKDLNSEEWVITSKDGCKRIVEISTSILRTSDSREHVLALLHDVTESKQFERDLADSEKQYRELFNSVMEGIGLVDKDEILVFANPAFARIFEFDSVEEMVGKSLIDYFTHESKEIVHKQNAMRARGESSQYELAILTAKGNSKWIYLSVTPRLTDDGSYAGALAAVMDITEKKKAESLQIEIGQKLERAERMESLGLLAGGVAHDLNNTLGPLVGYPELILSELPGDSPVRKMVERVELAARDAAGVIQDLLTLARRGRYELRPTDLNDVIRQYLDSPSFLRLSKQHPEVTTCLSLDSKLPGISGSSVNLAKVVMNLIINAYDAMPSGGKLLIETSHSYISTLPSGFGKLQPGDYVILRVRDEGIGIAPEDMGKIFEPYFSRKRMGRSGTGLGLAVVYGVVKDHNGYYDVKSEVGNGTEFLLYFPACKETVGVSGKPSNCVGGDEQILVVDDNEDVRLLMEEMLSSKGYQVRSVENGHEAVKFIKNSQVDLILLDMIMEPDFDGLDTYREIVQIRPGQKALVVTGYASTERVAQLLELGAGGLVKKPFNIATIASAVRSELDRPKVMLNALAT
jgi:PAS domain S-box-containing protein